MSLGEIVKLAANDGAAITGFGVLLWMSIANNRNANRRSDAMLERLLHGDGNGGASIAKAVEAAREARDTAKAADEKADLALTEAKAVREEAKAVRAEVVRLRTDGCSNRPEHDAVLATGGAS